MSAIDVTLLHAVNQYTGRWYALDLAMALVQNNDLLKGAPFVAAFVWFWFRPAARRARCRAVIVNTLPAVFAALVLNRTLAVLLPYRVRPLADTSVLLNAPYPGVAPAFDLENWSSFPSDHATFVFAMVASLWLLSRPAAVAAALYAVVVVCLPRAYFGVHYPLDLAVGALLGLATASAVNVVVRDRLLGPVIRFRDRHPEWLYTLMFLAAFETAAMFRNVRRLQHGLLVDAVRHLGSALRAVPHEAIAAVLALSVAAAVIAIIWLYRRQRRTPSLFPNSR